MGQEDRVWGRWVWASTFLLEFGVDFCHVTHVIQPVILFCLQRKFVLDVAD